MCINLTTCDEFVSSLATVLFMINNIPQNRIDFKDYAKSFIV
jgi:hypothetical protein